MVKVYYDHHCPVCKELARMGQAMAGGRIIFLPWQHFSIETPHDISIEVDGQMLTGLEAWEWLTKNFPVLKSLDWLVSKIGFKGRFSALWIRKTAKSLRYFCRKCPHRGY